MQGGRWTASGVARQARTLASFVALLIATFISAGGAMELVVAGQPVPGLTTELVPGISYAPASGLAAALGATLEADSRLAQLSLSGAVLRMGVFIEPAMAATGGSMTLDGIRAEGAPGALLAGGVLWLPVKAVVEAFGGFVTVMTRDSEVVATMPRARLTGLNIARGAGPDRVSVQLNALTPYSVYLNEALSTLHVRFSRASSAVGSVEVTGRHLSRAYVLDESGAAELRLEVERGASWSVTPARAGSGFELSVTVAGASTLAVPAGPPPGEASGLMLARVVIVPGPGTRAEALAGQVATLLEQSGVEALVSATGGAATGLDAAGGSLVLHLGFAGPAGVYLLGEPDAAADLELARSRSGSAEATDALRRELLLGAVEDDPLAVRFAAAISDSLQDGAGMMLGAPRRAPLPQLMSAAGRSVLLELDPAIADDPLVAAALAAAGVRALSQ